MKTISIDVIWLVFAGLLIIALGVEIYVLYQSNMSALENQLISKLDDQKKSISIQNKGQVLSEYSIEETNSFGVKPIVITEKYIQSIINKDSNDFNTTSDDVGKKTTYYEYSTSGNFKESNPSIVKLENKNYLVELGDTVFEVMRKTGISWKDIVKYNDLQPPYSINAGQVLSLVKNENSSQKSEDLIYTGTYQKETYKPYNPANYSGRRNYQYTGSTYTVKVGDTVFEIMRQTGVYWKDIISFNNLEAPSYAIQPGKVIYLKSRSEKELLSSEENTEDHIDSLITTKNRSSESNYTVVVGDTVFEIMRKTGVDWKDIIKFNNLKSPFTIEPDEVLNLIQQKDSFDEPPPITKNIENIDIDAVFVDTFKNND